MGRLDGKVAVITGASGGIGEAAARIFVREGARVVVADLQEEKGERVAASLGDAAVFVRTDVSLSAEVKRAVDTAIERFGALHVLFNNAGIVGGEGLIHESSEDRWQRIIWTNLKGPWLGIKHAVPHIIAAGGGSVINTASHSADMGIPHRGAYASSKAGLLGLTRVTAIENAPFRVRCNAIIPGAKGGIGSLEDPSKPDFADAAQQEFLSIWHGIPRPCEAEDMANAALWLATDESSFVTGQVIAVDGGWGSSPRMPMQALYEVFGADPRVQT